jgi:hypothetical protein
MHRRFGGGGKGRVWAKEWTAPVLVMQEEIEELHQKACELRKDSYIDPKTGYKVFTAVFHR